MHLGQPLNRPQRNTDRFVGTFQQKAGLPLLSLSAGRPHWQTLESTIANIQRVWYNPANRDGEMAEFEAAYVKLLDTGELQQRVEEARGILKECRLCGRE